MYGRFSDKPKSNIYILFVETIGHNIIHNNNNICVITFVLTKCAQFGLT